MTTSSDQGGWPLPATLQVPTHCSSADHTCIRPLDGAELFYAHHALVRRQRNRVGQSYRREVRTGGLRTTPEWARIVCAMETVERFSTTAAEVVERVLEPLPSAARLSWRHFSPYADEAATAFDHSGGFGWVTMAELSSERHWAVPSECVIPWFGDYDPRACPIPDTDGTGCAAGILGRAGAVVARGLHEVVERDAVMLSWRVDRWWCRPLDPRDHLDDALLGALSRAGLAVRTYDVGDPRLAPVVLALLEDRANDSVTCGLACNGDGNLPVLKALSEAVMLRFHVQREAMQPTPEPAAIADSKAHVLWGARHGAEILEWYEQLATGPNPAIEGPASGDLVERCRAVFGYGPLVVDLTDAATRRAGYVVFRVLVPDAYRKEYRHAVSFEGGARLDELRTQGAELHRAPHPFG